MAISKGTKRDSEISVKRYIGVAAVKVLALNPTAEQQNELYNSTNFTTDPVYVGTTKVKNKEGQEVEVPQIRLSFITKTNPKIHCNNEIEAIFPVTFFIAKAPMYNKDFTKVKVIDVYGRTAWATADDVKNKTIPMYSNGPARIAADFRPVYRGEEDVVAFLKTYLGIPNPESWNQDRGTFVQKPANELPECECRLDGIEKYFTGDVSELKEILTYQPENMVKILLGVRTADDGKQYQAVYTRMFVSVSSTNLDRLKNNLKEAQEGGAFSTTAFEVCDLKESSLKATDYSQPQQEAFNQTPTSDLPFGG